MSNEKLLTAEEYLALMRKTEILMLVLIFIIAGELLFIHLYFSEDICDWQLETMRHRYEKALEMSHAN